MNIMNVVFYYIYERMKRTSLILLVCCLWMLNVSCGSGNLFQPDKKNTLRAPSYPLITIDPYTSIWSFADRLNEDATRHWTGKEQGLLGVIELNGVSYVLWEKKAPEGGNSGAF